MIEITKESPFNYVIFFSRWAFYEYPYEDFMNAMQANVNLSQAKLDQLIEKIVANRCITRRDQTYLMSMLLSKDLLTFQEQIQVDKLFDGLRRGLIHVTD